MWGRSRDNDLRDEHLRAELDRLVPAMSPEGEWAKVLERAASGTFAVSPGAARGMRTEADTTSAAATPTATKTHPTESHLVSRDGRRRSAFAYAAISFAVLVLLAGLGTGIFEAVTQLGKDQPIVVITDDTIGISPGSTGQTTQTAASVETTAQSGSWERLPLTTEGGVVRILVMDPTDPSVLYAAVASSGLFKSTDGAESWKRLPMDEGDVG